MTATVSCPICGYKTEKLRVKGGSLRCARCRNVFGDPDAFSRTRKYIISSGTQLVNLRTQSAGEDTLYLDENHMCVCEAQGGISVYTQPGQYPLPPAGAHLAFISRSARIRWGVSGKNRSGMPVGCYGTARVSVDESFLSGADAQRFESINSFNERVRFLTAFLLRPQVEALLGTAGELNTRVLREYAASRVLDTGVTLESIEVLGYTVNGTQLPLPKAEPFAVSTDAGKPAQSENPAVICRRGPLRAGDQTVGAGSQYVLFPKNAKPYRVKYEEELTSDALSGAECLCRVLRTSFEFPQGWGTGNIVVPGHGRYGANGTVSFYIDGTLAFCELVRTYKSWTEFADGFSRQLALTIGRAINDAFAVDMSIRRRSADDITGAHALDELSARLTRMLAEGYDTPGQDREIPFMKYGLRCKQLSVEALVPEKA